MGAGSTGWMVEKVLGYGQYPDDVRGRDVLRQCRPQPVCPCPWLSIDTSGGGGAARCGVRSDPEGHPRQGECGPPEKDQPTMIGIGEITHYLGDAVLFGVCP